MSHPRVRVIIPTYNEIKNIERLLLRIFSQHIPNLSVLVVDDSSPDKTAEAVTQLATRFPVAVLKRPIKNGLGRAYIDGFAQSLADDGTDVFIQMDGDLSHDPEDLPRLLQAIADGADVVVGSRKIPGGKIIGWGWMRKAMSGGAMWISRTILGLVTRDVTSGYRCFTKRVLSQLPLHNIKSNGYAFQEEMLWLCEKNGFRVAEVPIVFIDRQEGKSKLSFFEIISFFINLFRLK